jgi:hypothetical protein
MKKKNYDYLGQDSKIITSARVTQDNYYFVDSCAKKHSQGNLAQELRLMVNFVKKNREEYLKEAPALRDEMIAESISKKYEEFKEKDE